MKRQSCRWIVPFVLAALGFVQETNAQGIVIPGAGPVNRSMAGAGVAAPLDAAGAIHWNPASMTGLESSEFVIGAELLYLTTHLGSSFGALSGETRSDSGVNILPTVAVVFQPEDSRWTFGLGMFSIGGFGVNLPGSTSNPILSAPPGGLGPIYSKLAVLQLAPTAALKLTERLSIGLAPTVSIADAALDPNAFAQPDVTGYPEGTHTRSIWGLGFQAGVYYETENCWHLGASYKSPQWFEEATFYAADPLVGPRTDRLKVDYPAIISLGAAYYGLPRTVWAIDLRYVDYANTQFFGDDTGYDGLAWTGLGWQSVVSVASGVQYQLTDALSLRAGYVYCDNPVADADTFFNVASAAIYQHIISVGGSWKISGRTSLVLAYLKAFENSISGPWVAPPGVPVPDTSATVRQTVDCLVAGLQVKF